MPPVKAKQQTGNEMLRITAGQEPLLQLIDSTGYLLPCGNWPSGEDEHYGCDIQGTPDKERQRSSAAPHRGQPGKADEQDGA